MNDKIIDDLFIVGFFMIVFTIFRGWALLSAILTYICRIIY